MQSIEIDPELNRGSSLLRKLPNSILSLQGWHCALSRVRFCEDLPGNWSGRVRHQPGSRRGNFKTRQSEPIRG